jgi:outer membrane immunogenic protein
VVGWEGDIAWANNNKTIVGIPGLESPTVAGAPGGDFSNIKQTWDASIRGRAGFLAVPSVLLYATGGALWRARPAERCFPPGGAA